MRSSGEIRVMRERVRKAWPKAVCPDDGPREDEMRLELKLHAAEVALDWALGCRDSGIILMEWVRQAETGEKPEPVDKDPGRAKEAAAGGEE